MKYILTLFTIFAFWSNITFAADFAEEIEDLPLMESFEIIDQDTIYFDKPEGRIITLTAFSANKTEDPFAFYAKTLPQLGWAKTSEKEYLREKEHLKIESQMREDGMIIKFYLSPRKTE
jgi:hypothetical protein